MEAAYLVFMGVKGVEALGAAHIPQLQQAISPTRYKLRASTHLYSTGQDLLQTKSQL